MKLAAIAIGSAGSDPSGVELPAAAIRPGVLLCDITSDNRVAMLRITDVQRDADGTPDQITLDVTVWVRLHQN